MCPLLAAVCVGIESEKFVEQDVIADHVGGFGDAERVEKRVYAALSRFAEIIAQRAHAECEVAPDVVTACAPEVEKAGHAAAVYEDVGQAAVAVAEHRSAAGGRVFFKIAERRGEIREAAFAERFLLQLVLIDKPRLQPCARKCERS